MRIIQHLAFQLAIPTPRMLQLENQERTIQKIPSVICPQRLNCSHLIAKIKNGLAHVTAINTNQHQPGYPVKTLLFQSGGFNMNKRIIASQAFTFAATFISRLRISVR